MQYTGSVSYKDIEDKKFLTVDNVDSQRISDIINALDKQNAAYSAQYDNTRITVTCEKADSDNIRKIIDSVSVPSQNTEISSTAESSKSEAALEELRQQILQMQENQQQLINRIEEERTEKERAANAVDSPKAPQQEVQISANSNIGACKPEHACLLPIISSKILKQEQKLEELKDRKSIHEGKITEYQTRAANLTEKADRLMAVNQMLAELMERKQLPAAVKTSLHAIIRNNDVKVAKIRNEKIPKLEGKIGKRMEKIESLDKRMNLAQCKINRYQSFNDVITSFTHFNKEGFSSALDDLHNNSIALLNAKIDVCSDRIINNTKLYKENPVVGMSLGIPLELAKLRQRERNLIIKKNKLMGVSEPYTAQSEQVRNEVFKKAESVVDNAVKQDNISPADVVDAVVESPISVIPQHVIITPPPSNDYPLLLPEIATIMDTSVSVIESKPNDVKELIVNDYINNADATPEEIQESLSAIMNPDVRTEEHLKEKKQEKEIETNQKSNGDDKKEKDNPLRAAEERSEDNANMIDGIPNNDSAKKEKEQQPKPKNPNGRFSFSGKKLKENTRKVSEEHSSQSRAKTQEPPNHGSI